MSAKLPSLRPLDAQDEAVLAAAQAAIRRGYDSIRFHHTVGAAVLCQSGKVYVGVNVYTLHGACAEQVAIGMAAAAGETEFLRIVVVRGARGEEILPPCGNCRQMLSEYAPDCEVILPGGKLPAWELLPFAYVRPE